jgi:hypothetical protein
MKVVFFAALMTVAASFAPTATSAVQDDYGVINKTGMTITHLYLSPSKDDQWGADILEKDVLADGEECGIEFDKDDEECFYDIKITDSKEQDWTVTNVDLCKFTKVTFTVTKGKMMYTAK